MFVVCVEFDIVPSFVERFHLAVTNQSANSLRLEPACKQFDVSRDPKDPTKYFLYELYDDAAAFDAHRQTPHFAKFTAEVTEMIAGKTLKTWQIVSK